jgi:hypothetical protein
VIAMPARLKALLQNAAIVVALAAGFTFFGVYGTGGPLWARFLMWLVTMATGAASAGFIIPFIFGTRFEPWPLALRILAGAALIAGPVTVSLMAFVVAFGGRPSFGSFPVQFLYVFAICLIMVVAGYVLSLARQAPSGNSELTQPDAAGAFLARLPLKYRQAELHALSSEDHYLRVHTSLGEELILMRLADAVRELEGAGGLQVHRSWWIAAAAVRDVKRSGGKIMLVLPSGKEAPVSRTYTANAREAGLV